jgi:hypothetical protein
MFNILTAPFCELVYLHSQMTISTTMTTITTLSSQPGHAGRWG